LAPGVRLSVVAEAMAEVLAPVTPQRGKAPFGHGIGMDNFEPPLLSVESNVVAQENMVIVIHPALVANGRNYYVGDTYLVTRSGAERLSEYPLKLIIV
jgi:Xaa-Pro aminopeptidase